MAFEVSNIFKSWGRVELDDVAVHSSKYMTTIAEATLEYRTNDGHIETNWSKKFYHPKEINNKAKLTPLPQWSGRP